ncbi:MAG: hypothetical protein S4CHLAM45_11680 [Chlamydiales bacterium]|nr:hypothetical protein [Chlamydiales bacterium]MCH9619660.1 hypothetical protein [Chlamydiales bacterium]MCH9623266.1 hypothetical protein [Chlamydiales bacterium]
MLKRFVEQLSNECGFEKPLSSNEEGSFFISFEPNIKVSLKESSEKVIKMHSVLAPLPKEKSDPYFLSAMKGNLFGAECGGNVLGLDGDGKNVVLARLLMPEVTYQEFRDGLEEFVNYAESCKLETEAFA